MLGSRGDPTIGHPVEAGTPEHLVAVDNPHLGCHPIEAAEYLDHLDRPALRVGPVHGQEVGTVEPLTGFGVVDADRRRQAIGCAFPVTGLHTLEECPDDGFVALHDPTVPATLGNQRSAWSVSNDMASNHLTPLLDRIQAYAIVVLAASTLLALAGCVDGGQVTAGTDPDVDVGGEAEATNGDGDKHLGIPVPEQAGSAHTGTEFCSTNTDNHRIEMAFNGTVRAIESVDATLPGNDPDLDVDTDADPRPLPWVTFDVDAWYTEDLGTEIALWGRDFDGTPGQRWLIAASRYTVGQQASGDIFWCVSEPESADGLAAWAADYGGTVAPGENRPENPPPPELLDQIEANRITWLNQAPSDYTAVVVNEPDHNQSNQSAPPDNNVDCPASRARLVVEDGEVVQALDVYNDCELDPASAPRIEDLFDTAAAAAGADEYHIEFDTDYGYIASLGAYDRSVSVSAGIWQFVPEALPMTSAGDQPAFEAALAEARGRWAASGITTYTITINNLCFCGFGGPAEVTVVDGDVVDIAMADIEAERAALDPNLGFVLTVDDAFDLIEEARADRLHVAYHPELGYPVEIDIDYITNAVDDELQVLILALTIDP